MLEEKSENSRMNLVFMILLLICNPVHEVNFYLKMLQDIFSSFYFRISRV